VLRCLAVDLGAGSGRVMLGTFANGRLALEELHRFENAMEFVDEHYRWNTEALLREILAGLRKAAPKGPIHSIGVNTWGVDFVLIGEDGERLEDKPVAYRDARTGGMIEAFFERMPREELYRRTGIQVVPYNSIYQLMALVKERSPLLDRATRFLNTPDYINYRLTGVAKNEYTIASTTQMLDVRTQRWDDEVIRSLGVRRELFADPIMPGTLIGALSEAMAKESGLAGTRVYAVGSHDTASAIAAIPATGDDWAYISSGTWCMMGIESTVPVASSQACAFNLTNEGGVGGTYRVLKNIMGLWLVRGLKNSLDTDASYSDLIRMASESEPFRHFVVANDSAFYNPESMHDAFDAFFHATGQDLPDSPGVYVRCAEESLAFAYRQVLSELREVQSQPIERIHVVGGGVQDALMCRLAADATGLPVCAGPVEATAIGNLIVQAMAAGEVPNREAARAIVRDSFEYEEYTPKDTKAWDAAWERYRAVSEIRK
jgi:rhamnulokinase